MHKQQVFYITSKLEKFLTINFPAFSQFCWNCISFDEIYTKLTFGDAIFLLKEFQIRKEKSETTNKKTNTLLTFGDAIHLDLYLSYFTISKG